VDAREFELWICRGDFDVRCRGRIPDFVGGTFSLVFCGEVVVFSVVPLRT